MEKNEIEIKKIENDIKVTNKRFWLDVVKIGVAFLGSFFVFVILRQPESILNRKVSKESIYRERAKLVLELMKKKDVDEVLLGLDVIEKSYMIENDWIIDIKRVYKLRKEKQLFDSLYRKKLKGKWIKELDEINFLFSRQEVSIMNEGKTKEDVIVVPLLDTVPEKLNEIKTRKIINEEIRKKKKKIIKHVMDDATPPGDGF